MEDVERKREREREKKGRREYKMKLLLEMWTKIRVWSIEHQNGLSLSTELVEYPR